MIKDRGKIKWKIGDRVTREIFMDDGTWAEKGDECLSNSPLRHGEVVAIRPDIYGLALYHVRWDDGTEGQSSFGHGIDAEKQESDSQNPALIGIYPKPFPVVSVEFLPSAKILVSVEAKWFSDSDCARAETHAMSAARSRFKNSCTLQVVAQMKYAATVALRAAYNDGRMQCSVLHGFRWAFREEGTTNEEFYLRQGGKTNEKDSING